MLFSLKQPYFYEKIVYLCIRHIALPSAEYRLLQAVLRRNDNSSAVGGAIN